MSTYQNRRESSQPIYLADSGEQNKTQCGRQTRQTQGGTRVVTGGRRGGGGRRAVALAANMESSRTSAVVNIALPGVEGQVDVDDLIRIGAGDLLVASSLGGIAVTSIQ